MKVISVIFAFVFGLLVVLVSTDRVPATVPAPAIPTSTIVPVPSLTATAIANQPEKSVPDKPAPEKPAAAESDESEGDESPPAKFRPFDQVVKGTQRLEGLFTLYRDRNDGRLYAEIRPDQLNVNHLCTITLESGLGEGGLYSGLPLADFLFTFRRVNNRLQFAVPNVYFRTRPGDPLQRSVQRSFSNSVLQALPIRSIHPQRKSILVDLTPLLLSDLPGLNPNLSMMLGADYAIDASKSYLGTVKTFPQNVELESVYGFSSGNPNEFPAFITSLPDSRTFNLRVRYSLSQLPTNNGYKPRAADDRIGYFVTAYQNLSEQSSRPPFVRYINRWHLEKQDPTAPLSRPKQPIVFWIENTVPLEYREAVREGILMWNKAFEQAGFEGAIEARQMPDKATWDSADVRYNTIRWLASYDNGFLGIGPSRVNPLTGQILDADILIDASFAQFIKQQYESLADRESLRWMPSLAKLTGNPRLCSYGSQGRLLQQSTQPQQTLNPRLALQLMSNYDLCFGLEASHQLAIGAMSMTMMQNALPNSEAMQQYVRDFLRTLIAHEVGHTLGLRHNFRASAMLPPQELNNTTLTREKGLVGSVMDYTAVNLAPFGATQGDYYTRTIGPYDGWAIEYGYRPNADQADPIGETRMLQAIARRAPEPDLAFATDEDTFADLDPHTHRFDLSSDLLTYAPWQLDNAQQMWQRLERRYPLPGGSYNDVRVLFDEIFDYYFQYSNLLTTYVGGQSFNRFRQGDAAGRLPFEPVSLEQQRQALKLLQTYVFDDRRFQFSPQFLNKLAPSRWMHWGQMPSFSRLDYPIYDRILFLQSIVLSDLLNVDRLARLRDAELKAPPGQALTLPELFDSLQTSIWGDVLQPANPLQLSGLRRGLQRQHLEQLVQMVLRSSDVPEDARTLSWYHLKQLRGGLDTALRRRGGMDTYTRAHLEETRDRITKALNSELRSQ